MENEILDNIYHLYRGHIVDLIIAIILCCVAVLIAIGVIKFELLNTKIKCILLLLGACLCSILLIGMHIIELLPIRTDYKESSYIILENATMTVTGDLSSGLNRIHEVVVMDKDGNRYNLQIESSYVRDYGSYTGTIVYLEHSGFVIWYNIDS